MFKRGRRLLVSLAVAISTAISPVAATAQVKIPYLTLPTAQPKYAAIVVDAKTGEVLYAKRADSPRYPASITKVMTLYLTFEALQTGRLKPDDLITISPRAAAQAPTKLGLAPGETLTVSDAMQALAIKSANDIAVALAEHIGGSEARFAAMMTLRAQELGMANSRFVNASGLPDSRQVSSARDIAILSRAVMRDHPQYYRLFSQQAFVFRGVTMRNHNGLLGVMPGVDGLKTGYTNASGYNVAVSAMRDNRRLITVVLGAPSTASRNNNAEDLLLTGFDVMNRRAKGEKITVAQNLFEPEPTGPIERPSSEQGDGEQDGLKIVLASAPTKAPTYFKIVEPAATPLRGTQGTEKAKAKKPEVPAGKWAVQVGAFKSKADAKEQLAMMAKRFAKQFAHADANVGDKVDDHYRARFKGMTEASARDACKALKAKKQVCMVVPPA